MGWQDRRAYRCRVGEPALRLSALLRYWHTLRHLRAVQFYGRLWFRLARPLADLSDAPALRACTGAWQAPARREPSLVGAGHFELLGEHGTLAELGWDGPQREKLWRYNQHYFDDLNAVDAGLRSEWHRHLLDDWVQCNSVGLGNGWEPYPTSLRIVNWIKWALGGNVLPDPCLHSLAVQARWLSKRLEIHLLGNHLFANAKALVLAGLFFQGDEADRWLSTGLKILARELPEQVLPDGGHFERSTMYHALALEDMLDLRNALCAYPAALTADQRGACADWPALARQMHAWLQSMCHPDGEISFFNDAALGVAPAVAELGAYAARLGLAGMASRSAGVTHLADSGYIRLSAGDAVAILDVAPVGPDYLPGHAHADTLSFELSLFGQRVLVNTGTSCYGGSAERLRQRGTAAHNTVVVDGHDSSEVWGGFRVARRARPFGLHMGPAGACAELPIEVRCAHDGYERLPGRPVHQRRWLLDQSGLVVEDIVTGVHAAALAQFHLHPQLKLLADASAQTGEAMLPDGRRLAWVVQQGHASLEVGTYHPRFGLSFAGLCLIIRLAEGRSRIQFSWQEFKK